MRMLKCCIVGPTWRRLLAGEAAISSSQTVTSDKCESLPCTNNNNRHVTVEQNNTRIKNYL